MLSDIYYSVHTHKIRLGKRTNAYLLGCSCHSSLVFRVLTRHEASHVVDAGVAAQLVQIDLC